MHAKLQHYIPQFYLRHFATKAKKGYLTCCFDKLTRKPFRPNIKNVASQTYFYDFTDSAGNEVSIEEAFNDLETETAKAFQAIIENPKISTVLSYKEVLAYFFIVQDSRTQVFRDTQNDIIRFTNQKLSKDGFSFSEQTEDQNKEFQARFLENTSPQFANVLLDMKWILLKNRTHKPFWISDNPVFKYNPMKSELQGDIGLMCDGIQIHVPINPSLVITICDPIAYAHLNSELSVSDLRNIEFNNSGQVAHSKQHIFSIDDDFQLAQDMIENDPNLSNPNRARIIDGAESMFQSYNDQNSSNK